MNRIKVWPHLTVVGVVVALLAGLGTAWYLNQEQTASAEELPYAARIQRVDGEVALSDAGNTASDNAAEQQWIAAVPNQPFSVGDRLYTRDNSRASIAFTGRNFARLNPNTSLDVVNLYDDRTQVALREGSATFDVGYPGDLFEVGTPYGAVQFDQPGLYDVGFDDEGNVLVSVLSGVAQVVGLAGSGQINKGEMLTLVGQTAASVLLSKLDGGDAGYLVDDYYRYQYPDDYDGRYSSYDAYLNDPYYYDPYRRNPSYQYVSSIIPGINDLDHYGDWQSIDNYGYAWRPRVDAGWTPYQHGSWTTDYPYGATWVSNEPWGYAPYHYGRWANVANQWYWIPDGVNTTPVYSPGLVAFVPVDDNQIGWVPLAPGERYVPRYYDENWQPHYLTRADLSPSQLVNLAIPGAVTVIPIDAFGRVIEPRSIRRLDPQVFASLRPTLEPLTLTPLRNAVLHSAWGRGKINLPPGIAKKLDERRIFVSDVPVSRRSREDLAKSLRVERVSDRDRKEKFKVRQDEPRDIARRIDARQAREVEKQQREQERNARKAVDQPRGERVGNPGRHVEQQQRQQEKAVRRATQQPQGERISNPGRPQVDRPSSKPEFKGPPQKTGRESRGGGKGKGIG